MKPKIIAFFLGVISCLACLIAIPLLEGRNTTDDAYWQKRRLDSFYNTTLKRYYKEKGEFPRNYQQLLSFAGPEDYGLLYFVNPETHEYQNWILNASDEYIAESSVFKKEDQRAKLVITKAGEILLKTLE